MSILIIVPNISISDTADPFIVDIFLMDAVP